MLVLVHELGHFLAAKKAGIGVVEFGLGLPPRIWGKKIGETTYSLNALPIGGFVKLIGEDEEESEVAKKDKDRAFYAKSKLAKIMVVTAGVFMNFLLAVLIFTFLYSKLGIPTEVDEVQISAVAPDSPAAIAGIREGDAVRTVKTSVTNGQASIKEIRTPDEFTQVARDAAGEELEVTLVRDGQQVIVTLVPRANPPEGQGPLGVAITNVVPKFYPWYEMPFRSAVYGIRDALQLTRMIAMGIVQLFVDWFSRGRVPEGVSGPIGIYQLTAEVAKTGIINTINLIGLLSVNLAVLNILPFPALDGGRLLFIVIESIFGRKVAPRLEKWVHAVGLAILVAMIIMISFRDIQRLINGQKLF